MIGIVLVSHSETLARGVLELAEQMTQGRVPIALAAGMDNPDDPIGTDPLRVLSAIEAVYSEDGVLLLMDLGSAIMSAEAAIEFLPPEQQAHIYLCEAPLVEGALAAAVQAMSGASIEALFTEARGALAAKTEQLRPLLRIAPPSAAAHASPAAPDFEASESIILTIPNRLGLHARPAARLVRLASGFDALIRLGFKERWVSATSINQVATLGLRQGDEVTIQAAGPDAAAALAALAALAGENFGDYDEPGGTAAPVAAPTHAADEAVTDRPGGYGATTGVAVGPAQRLAPAWPSVVHQMANDPAAEARRFAAAVAAAAAEVRTVFQTMLQRAGPAEAAIFDAHLLMLADADLLTRTRDRIDKGGLDAASAWHGAIEETAAEYRALGGYMARRADDVLDVGMRVLSHLADAMPASAALPDTPVVLVAEMLTPAEVADLDDERVLGVVTARGTPTDHSAVLLRAFGIPAVVGAGVVVERIEDGQTIGLDGADGRLWLAPDATTVATLAQERSAWLARRQAARDAARQPATLRSGHRIPVFANIGSAADVPYAVAQGAEGVGLFRTEFLFMQRGSPPDEAEQFEVYLQAAQALGGRPLVVRTLDVGGDKPLPYWPMDDGANPFLGLRGIRYCLQQPECFLPQLRALLRVAVAHELRIMLPMVSVVEEIQQTRMLLATAVDELRERGEPTPSSVALGVMIETPAAVTTAGELARHVDFFSIGTNDLTQYMMAADRTNARTAGLASVLQPAVIHAIHAAVDAAHAAGIEAAVCGEMAGDPLLAPLLVGLGVDELSASGAAIPQVKARLRGLAEEEVRALARQALTLTTAAEMRSLVEEFAADRGS
ncbi:MAG: phosphoenolpyruvate--protein phosphotransferase [Anaerolineae bacterium]